MTETILTTPRVLMSLTDVAELAGKGRPLATKWMRRDIGFPAPVGGDTARPLFDPVQVADWLLTTGRIDRERAEQEVGLFLLAGLAASYPGPDVIAAVTALLCLRYQAGEQEPLSDRAGDPLAAARALAEVIDPNDCVLLTEVRSIPPTGAWLIGQVDELVEASYTCGAAFEKVMTARHRFGAGAVAAAEIAKPLGRLTAELSGAAERTRPGHQLLLADPAAGPGDLLAAVVHLLGPDHPPRVAAAEPDEALARLVRRRMLVQGIPDSDLDIRVGTELPDECGEPDVIVTQLPYQPVETRDPIGALTAVDDVAVRLSRGRFGVVLGPADVLTGDLGAYSPAERARAKLLTSDMVEAVVRLPKRLVPFRPGYETALWVVTQARASRWRGRVMLADVSDRDLTEDVIRDLVEDVTTWRREGFTPAAHQRVYGEQVAIADLVNPPRPLLASRRPVSPRERANEASQRVLDATRFGIELDELTKTATTDRQHVSTGMLQAADRNPPSDTIGALVKSRRLRLHQGTRTRAQHIRSAGHHVVLGSDEVLGIRRPGGRWIDRETFARDYHSARLTEPGDVLVNTGQRFAVMVDKHGYAVAEFPVRILRIPAAEIEQFTPRVLAALLFTDGATARPRSGNRSLEEQRVLLLAPAEVRRLDQLLTEIDARRDLARKELDVLDELRKVAIGGLTDGTLTLTTDEPSPDESSSEER
jgi:hypothetical protein